MSASSSVSMTFCWLPAGILTCTSRTTHHSLWSSKELSTPSGDRLRIGHRASRIEPTQYGNFCDRLGIDILPVEPVRSTPSRLGLDGPGRRHDQIQRHVVAIGLDSVDELAVVDGRGDRRGVVDAVEPPQDGELEIAVPLAFAD